MQCKEEGRASDCALWWREAEIHLQSRFVGLCRAEKIGRARGAVRVVHCTSEVHRPSALYLFWILPLNLLIPMNSHLRFNNIDPLLLRYGICSMFWVYFYIISLASYIGYNVEQLKTLCQVSFPPLRGSVPLGEEGNPILSAHLEALRELLHHISHKTTRE